MLGDKHHNLLVRLILTITLPVERWHAEQNKQLRDAASSVSWLLAQIKGGFMNHIHQILQTLSELSSLEYC
eukprot:10300913-Heterocapsa_arctica.AAC.1